MKKNITESDLCIWNDADELIAVLGHLQHQPISGLVESVAPLLDHEDPDVREEAMRTLFVHWKAGQWRSKAIEALGSDPSSGVWRVAPHAIAATSTPLSRARDILMLVDVLRNEQEDLAVRGAAYDSLLVIFQKPSFPTKKRDFDPQKDVDWIWVNSLGKS